MSRTVKGGSSPRQVAARRGRELQRQDRQWQRDFKKLQGGGNEPKAKPTGPTKRG